MDVLDLLGCFSLECEKEEANEDEIGKEEIAI